MNFSIETAALSSAIGLLLLAISFRYLNSIVPSKSALTLWAIAFFALSVDNFMFALQPFDLGLLLPFFETVHMVFVCLILIGVLRFLDAEINLKFIGASAALIIGWGFVMPLVSLPFMVETMPSSIVSSSFILYGGYRLLAFRPVASESGYKLAGWAFIVWAINRPTYSFLGVFPEFGPWGYMIAQASALCMGIGLIVAVLERQRKEALIAQNEAQQASEAKTKFLAAASHDLRQPVQALMLFAGTLKTAGQTSEVKTVVGRISASLDSLRGLLDTLLDISRLEAGLIKPRKEPVNLGKLLANLAAGYSVQAEAKGISFKYVPRNVNVLSDPTLIENLLRNLIGNALKYTDEGRVLVGCRNTGGKIRVEVWDTGRGIPESQLEQIFQDFHQVSASSRDRNQGLGLGLAIVRRLSSLLETKVEVRSQFGKGSVFSVELQVTTELAEQTASAMPLQEKPAEELHIALVDDNFDVLESMSQILMDRGHEVLAFDELKKDGSSFPVGSEAPNLIISDNSLSNGLSGLEAINQLRDRYGQGIPAIILTGDTSPKVLNSLTQTGIPVLHKPVRPSELIDMAERIALHN